MKLIEYFKVAYTSEFQACMGFYLYQCEVIILGILKERSTKNLIEALKKYEDSKLDANMEDLKSFMSAFLNTSDKKQRRKLADEFKRRHMELYQFIKDNSELINAETEVSKIVTNTLNGNVTESENAEISNLFKIIEEGLNE